MAEPLTDAEVNAALEYLSGWEPMGWKSTEEIRKTFRFHSFAEAWQFISRFVAAAEGLEQHIGLEICRPGGNGLTPVRISLGHHGNVTPEDLALAERVEAGLAHEPYRPHAPASLRLSPLNLPVIPQLEAFTVSEPAMTERAALTAANAFLRRQCASIKNFNFGNINFDDPTIRFVSGDDARYHSMFSGRATWITWFHLKVLPEGIDMYPDYNEVFVDDLTGEAWWYNASGKSTPTTWTNPWLKKKILKRGGTSAV